MKRSRRSEVQDLATGWSARVLETAIDSAEVDLDYNLTAEELSVFQAKVYSLAGAICKAGSLRR